MIVVPQNRSEQSSVLIREILVKHATKHLIRDFMILGLVMGSGKGRGKDHIQALRYFFDWESIYNMINRSVV